MRFYQNYHLHMNDILNVGDLQSISHCSQSLFTLLINRYVFQLKQNNICFKVQPRTKLLKHFAIPCPPTMLFWQMD